MIDKLKNIDFIASKTYVLGISNKENVDSFYLILLKNKKDELTVEYRESFESFEICLKALKKDYPVMLYFSGKTVLNRLQEKENNSKKDLIFNSNPNDFVFYDLYQSNKVFTSVVRKKIVNSYVEKVNKAERFVIHVGFGPFILKNLKDILKQNVIKSDSYTALFDENNQLISYEFSNNKEVKYIIDEETINEKEAPLLSTYLDYKIKNDNVNYDTSFLRENIAENKNKNLFKKIAYISLSILLICLLFSHVLQNQLQNQLANKSSLYEISKTTQSDFEKHQLEKKIKEDILLSSSINNKDFLTKYYMDIGNSVSNGIALNSIKIFNPQKKIVPFEDIEFNSNKVIVEGTSISDSIFNNWIIRLEKLKWILNIDISEYIQDESLNSFKIVIYL